MFSYSKPQVRPPRVSLTIMQAKRPTVPYYRFLYHTVGDKWHWTSRKKLTDVELAAIIQDPKVEIHVLYVDGVPAGFAELDRRIEGQIELTQFGLMPEFLGQSLGKYFLQWTIERVWIFKPTRLWLHTCNLDHPAALPNYLKAGFEIYQEGLHHEDKEESETRP